MKTPLKGFKFCQENNLVDKRINVDVRSSLAVAALMKGAMHDMIFITPNLRVKTRIESYEQAKVEWESLHSLGLTLGIVSKGSLKLKTTEK